jgi:YHS domain-containing protein
LDQANQSSNSEFKTPCGGKLKDPTNYPKVTYRGVEIYFCTLACLSAFKENPDPFMAGEIKHHIHKKDED